MKFLLDLGLVETLCDSHDQMVPDVKGRLSGEQSKNLLTYIRK
jgi:hypothetical protein